MSRALCARRLCRERSSRFSKVVDRASDRPHVRQRPRPSERVDNTPRPAPLRTVASSLARRRGGIVVVATARRTLRTRRRRARSVRTRDRAGSATRVRFIEGARGLSSSLGIKDRRGVVASRRSRTRPRGRHVDGGNAVSDGGGRRHRCARASPRADRATERSIARADRSLARATTTTSTSSRLANANVARAFASSSRSYSPPRATAPRRRRRPSLLSFARASLNAPPAPNPPRPPIVAARRTADAVDVHDGEHGEKSRPGGVARTRRDPLQDGTARG